MRFTRHLRLTGDTRENGQYRTSGEEPWVTQIIPRDCVGSLVYRHCGHGLRGVAQRYGRDQLRRVWFGFLGAKGPRPVKPIGIQANVQSRSYPNLSGVRIALSATIPVR